MKQTLTELEGEKAGQINSKILFSILNTATRQEISLKKKKSKQERKITNMKNMIKQWT